MVDRVLPGRILLADRYYAGYWLLALSDLKGIDIVARAHQLRKIDFHGGMKLGSLDQIVAYDRPQRPSWMTEQEYERYPRMILIRHMKYKIGQRGFRTRQIILATTLLNAKIYSADKLAELYRQRWQVELHIRVIRRFKTGHLWALQNRPFEPGLVG
jgi:IS4 transposase